jgi:hypothetical protein
MERHACRCADLSVLPRWSWRGGQNDEGRRDLRSLSQSPSFECHGRWGCTGWHSWSWKKEVVLAERNFREMSERVGDGAGNPVSLIAPAWALDARGRSVPTHYLLSGGTITQVVEHGGATYPVVADPSFGCSGLICSVTYSRAETTQLANVPETVGVLIGAGCSLLGPVVIFECGLSAAYISDSARRALAAGKCVALQRNLLLHIAWLSPVNCPR